MPFKYTGKINKVTVKPGLEQFTPEDKKKAEGQRHKADD